MKNTILIILLGIVCFIPMDMCLIFDIDITTTLTIGCTLWFFSLLVHTMWSDLRDKPFILPEAANEINNLLNPRLIPITPRYYLSEDNEVYIKDKLFVKARLVKRFNSDQEAVEYINTKTKKKELIRIK